MGPALLKMGTRDVIFCTACLVFFWHVVWKNQAGQDKVQVQDQVVLARLKSGLRAEKIFCVAFGHQWEITDAFLLVTASQTSLIQVHKNEVDTPNKQVSNSSIFGCGSKIKHSYASRRFRVTPFRIGVSWRAISSEISCRIYSKVPRVSLKLYITTISKSFFSHVKPCERARMCPNLSQSRRSSKKPAKRNRNLGNRCKNARWLNILWVPFLTRMPSRNKHWHKSNSFLSCKWRRPCPRFTARVLKFRNGGPKMNVV